MLGSILLGSYLLADSDSSGGGGPSLDQGVSNTLTLTHSVAKVKVLNQSASNTLTFTQLAIARALETPASSTLVLTQDVVESHYKYRKLFANLDLTHSVEKEIIYTRSIEQTLILTQSVKRVVEVSVSNDLILSQTVAFTNSKYITQTLTLSHSVSLQKVYGRIVSQTIPLSQVLQTNKVLHIAVASPLALQQQIGRIRVKNETVSSLLSLTQEAVRLRIVAATSNLVGLSHSVSVQRVIARKAQNTLILNHTLQRQVAYSRSITQTLKFYQDRIKNIRIGELTEILVPGVIVSNVRGAFGDCGENQFKTIVLQSHGRSIVLPRPELGDREAGTDIFALSQSMTGVQRTTVKRSSTQVLNWSFDIKYQKWLELEEFVWVTNTNAVYIDDHKGRLWVGKLLSNPIQFTDFLEPEYCRSKITVNLDFEALRLH